MFIGSKRVCHGAFTLSRYVVCLLTALLAAPGLFAESSEDLLRFIIAEQTQRVACATNCSFNMNSTGYYFEDDHAVPVSTIVHAILSDENAYIEKEYNIVRVNADESTRGVDRVAARLWAINGDKIVIWPDMTRPVVNLYVKSDWENEPVQFAGVIRDHLVYDPRFLAYCTENSQTLAKAIEADLQSLKRTWTVETKNGSDGSPELFILRRSVVGAPRPDLTVHVDPKKDFVITRSEFEPYSQRDAYKRVCTKDYERVDGKWAVVHMELVSRSSNYAEPVDSVVTEFSDFLPIASVQSQYNSLDCLQLPQRVLARRLAPGNGSTAKQLETYVEMRDGVIHTLDNISQALEEFGVRRKL